MKNLEDKLALMKDYLLFCFEKDDFHGCMDAAADIRELLTEIRVRKELDSPKAIETVQQYLSAQKPKKKSIWHRLKKLFFYRFSVFK